mgnify:CR=1 FL=1
MKEILAKLVAGNDLSVEERRNFVPEFLVADTNDIHITEYFAGQKTV